MPKLRKQNEEGLSVRLALGAQVVKSVGEKAFRSSPTVRLAMADGQAERNGTLEGPVEQLAHKVNNQGDRTLEEGAPTVRLATPLKSQSGANSAENAPESISITGELRPALLVSYVYLKPFLINKHRYHYRDWVMDSGAFSAHNSGTEIKLQDYIDCCKKLLQEDQTLTEVFALDVIGDWKASLKNTEKMWQQGISAIPCFHYGEPWDILKGLAKDYPKIAIGGCVGRKDKDKFAGQCFSRVWPHRLHGFGFGSEKSIMMYPWHSVDATNWEIAPCKYGQWKAFGTQRVSVRGSRQNLRAEVEWYLELERKARNRWEKEMVKLAKIPDGRTVRLCPNGNPSRQIALAPIIRLVGAADDITDRRPQAFSKRGEEQMRPRKIIRSKK